MAKRVTLSELRNIIGKQASKAEQETIQKLAKLGYEAIMYAYKIGHSNKPPTYKKPVRDGKWRSRTRNLHDSFGSAVYYNGKLIESSIRFIGGEFSRKKDPLTNMSGRETLLDYFKRRSYGGAKHEMVLVCVAAMYYTKYLENGTHNGKYKIQVISAARDYIDQNFNKYFDTKTRAIVLKGVKPISNEKVGLL